MNAAVFWALPRSSLVFQSHHHSRAAHVNSGGGCVSAAVRVPRLFGATPAMISRFITIQHERSHENGGRADGHVLVHRL